MCVGPSPPPVPPRSVTMSSPPSPGQGGSPPRSPPSPPPLQPLTLTDLPDDVLDLITAAAYSAGGYSGLFSACRRLAEIGPASIVTLAVRRPCGPNEEVAAAAAVDGALPRIPMPGYHSRADLAAGDVPVVFTDVAERGCKFLRRAVRVRAVSLQAGDCSGSACAACQAVTVATGDGGWGERPAPRSVVTASIDAWYGRTLMPALRRMQLHSFSASDTVVGWLGTERLTGARLRVLHLHYIPSLAWRAVVVPLVVHHGGSLTELTLGGVAFDCWPTHPEVGNVFNAPVGGMPALRTLTLIAVCFSVDDAAAVVAACPELTSLTVDGLIGRDACRALDAYALPALTRLSWTVVGQWSQPGDLTRLLADRSLEAVSFAYHFGVGPFAVHSTVHDVVVTALNDAAALPVELDLVAVGFFTITKLRRLVDASINVARLARLRVALDADAIAEGLPVLGRLPALASLSIVVTDEQAVFGGWPIEGLTHLGVAMWPGVPPQALIPPLLDGLAASPTASTLCSLALTCRPLEAASSAEQLGRLTRLRHLYCRFVDDDGVPYRMAADAAAAREPMARWMLERLPRITVVAGVPSHWAG